MNQTVEFLLPFAKKLIYVDSIMPSLKGGIVVACQSRLVPCCRVIDTHDSEIKWLFSYRIHTGSSGYFFLLKKNTRKSYAVCGGDHDHVMHVFIGIDKNKKL